MTQETETTSNEADQAGADQAPEGTEAPAAENQDNAAPADQGEGATDQKSGFGAKADGADDAGADFPDFGEAYLGEDGKPDLAKINERLKSADALAEKMGEVPKDVSGYEIPTVEELGLPEGFDGGFDAEDDDLKAFLAAAKDAGKGKAQVKEELTAYAKAVSASIQKYHASRDAQVDAEFQKIGKERFDAASNALKTLGGDTQGETYAEALGSVDNAALFEVVEALIAKAGGAGDSPFGRSGGNDKPASLADRWAGAAKKSA